MDDKDSLCSADRSSLGILNPNCFLNRYSDAESSLGLLPSSYYQPDGLLADGKNVNYSQRFDEVNNFLTMSMKQEGLNDVDNESIHAINFNDPDFLKLDADFSDFSEDDNENHNKKRTKDVQLGPRPSHGAGCGVDSHRESDIDTDDEIRASLQSRNRPGLEGCDSKTSQRETAEGCGVMSPLPGGGDGSSGNNSGTESTASKKRSSALSSRSSNHESILSDFDINKYLSSDTSVHSRHPSEESNISCLTSGKGELLSRFLRPTTMESFGSYGISCWGDETALSYDVFAARETKGPADGSEDKSNGLNASSLNKLKFDDAQISARSSSLTGSTASAVEKRSTLDKSRSNNTVNPFDSSCLSFAKLSDVKDADFLSAGAAIQQINNDEAEFEKEHMFDMGAMPPSSMSINTSWLLQNTLNVTRPSWMSEDGSGDKRVSFGQFIQSKTAAIGALDKMWTSERPRFSSHLAASSLFHVPPTVLEMSNQSIAEEENTNVSPLSFKVGDKHSEERDVSMNSQSSFDATDVASITAIKKALAEASVSTDSKTLLHNFFQRLDELSGKKKPQPVSDRRSLRSENSISNAAVCQQLDWEVIRPSAVLKPDADNLNTPTDNANVKFLAKSDTVREITPCSEAFANRGVAKYQTSTPYVPNDASLNFSENCCTQIYSSVTPRVQSREIVPRMITMRNDDSVDQDKTITDDTPAVQTPTTIRMGSQKVAEKTKTRSMATTVSSSSNRFLPLVHQTFVSDDDQTIYVSRETDDTFILPSKSSAATTTVVSDRSSVPTFGNTLCTTNVVSLQKTMSIRVPSEVKFKNVACIGIATEETFRIKNPTSKWLQCNLKIDSCTINGQPSAIEMSSFKFKEKVVVEPNSDEEITILHASLIPGSFVAQIVVTSRVVSDGHISFPESSSSIMVHAESEHPNIQVLLDGNMELNFGTLPEDSCTSISVGMINMGRAIVPVRLVIRSSSSGSSCFFFPKKNAENVSPPVRNLVSSNVLSCTIPGRVNSEAPLKVVNFDIAFRAPTVSSLGKDLVGQVMGKLGIEIDVPTPENIVLQKIRMVAVVGMIQLETVKDVEPLILQAPVGSYATYPLLLRNSGSIELKLQVTVQRLPQSFSIVPATLTIPPGRQSEVVINYIPKTFTDKTQNILLLQVCPGGPLYEIQLITEVLQKRTVQNVNIQSNVPCLSWAGTAVGTKDAQSFLLKTNDPVQVQIIVRGNDFVLNFKDEPTTSHTLTLHPNNEYEIPVAFVPKSFGTSTAKLFIKPLDQSHGSKPIRFTIPLLGYSGRSELTGLNHNGDGTFYSKVDRKLQKGGSNAHKIKLQNKGSRAAFVKIVAEAELSSAEIVISPNELVIDRNNCVDVVAFIKLQHLLLENQPDGLARIGSLTVYYGDEVLRRSFRRFVETPTAKLPDLNNSFLQNINFDVPYNGEQLVNEEEIPFNSNTGQLFYNGIATFQLDLVADCYSVPIQRSATPNLKQSLTENRPMSSASPPVRETQNRFKREPPLREYKIEPDELNFVVQSNEDSVTQTFKLTNNSFQETSYELMWPAHLLDIPLGMGKIPPRDCINICVTPSSNLSHSSLPWNGRILIIMNGKQEEIGVNVTKGTVRFPLQLESEMVFPNTCISTLTELPLKIKNVLTSQVDWILSSSASVKLENHLLTLQKSYVAFKISNLSGRIEPKQTIEIPVTFAPLTNGLHAQSWLLKTEVDNSVQMMKVHFIGKAITISTDIKTKKPHRSIADDKLSIGSLPSESKKTKDRGLEVSEDSLTFSSVPCGSSACLKLKLMNRGSVDHQVRLSAVEPPFAINQNELQVWAHKYIRLPVHFKPQQVGVHHGRLLVTVDNNQVVEIGLRGIAV